MKVLMVCLGNICRSPTAQGVLENHIKNNNLESEIEVDSAGTHGYHIGSLPDSRSIEHASKRGIDITHQRSRKVAKDDFELFDSILAMDNENYINLLAVCPSKYQDKIHKFMSFTNSKYQEVPDPYYGGGKGFELVLDLLEEASEGFLQQLNQ